MTTMFPASYTPSSIRITHFSHDQHKLVWKTNQTQFTCNGCKETGYGGNYVCEAGCNYHLHHICATASENESYSFHNRGKFSFYRNTLGHHVCDACGVGAKGYVFVKENDYALHPTCAKFQETVQLGEHKLKLSRKPTSRCDACDSGEKGKKKGWSYSCGELRFHLSCVKELLGKGMEQQKHSLQEIRQNSPGGVVKEISLASTNLQMAKSGAGISSTGKLFWKIGRVIIQFIISTFLGDPTGLILPAFGALLSLLSG